jgi:ABC-type transport system substrate-binding protein
VKGAQAISGRPGWLGVWHSMNKESNDGLFDDVRVRRAYSMALDRDGLIEAFGEISKLKSEGIDIESGWTNANIPWGDGGMFWWLDPKGPDFGEHARWYQHDPAESKKLLDAADYTGDTVDFNFVTARYGTTYDQFTEAQIPMLRDAGFTVEPKSWEYRRVIGTEEGRNLPGVFYNYGTPYTTVDEYVFNQYVAESERIAMKMTCPPRTGPSTGLENLCGSGRGGRGMSKRKRYAAEEIIAKLREAEVHLAQGQTVGQVVRRLGISEQTYYRWRREYGGIRVDQAKRLKELERENARLKQLVAEQALDNSILREVAQGNF